MILSPEAIEAAARALYVEQNWCTVNAELDEDPVPKSEYKRMAGLLWDKGGLGYENTKKYMRLGESAAMAAAPFIAAQAKAEALQEFADEIRDFSGDHIARHIEDMARARAATIEGKSE